MSSENHDQLFATTVLEAFEEAGAITDKEVAAAKGPSNSWMTELRRLRDGKQVTFKGRPRPDTLRKIDTAAKWVPGSARKLLLTGLLPDQGELGSARTVSPSTETVSDVHLNTRRPEGISEREWAEMVRQNEDHWQYLLDKANRER